LNSGGGREAFATAEQEWMNEPEPTRGRSARRVTVVRRAGALGRQVTIAAARLGLALAWHALARRPEPEGAVVGRTLAALFRALGPTYVKIGQILATRQDLLGEEVVRELDPLQDRLPPAPFAAVARSFRAELGLELPDVFTELHRRPIASASIASVYRGRLHDGRQVAVKVRRPGIVERVAADLRLLELGASAIGRLPAFRSVPIRVSLDEFAGCVRRQLDFRAEADAARRVRALLSSQPDVVVPALVDRYCSASILTMKLVPTGRVDGGGGKSRQALLTALRALYLMIFVEGLVHCDLHRGNLHLLQDGRAVIVDFGFMAELPDAVRRKFAEFFFAMAANDGPRCAQIVVDTAEFLPPDLAYPEFEAELSEIVARAAGARVRDFRVADFVLSLFDLERRYRIYGTTAFTMAIVSLLVFEGIAKSVDGELDFQQEAAPFLARALLEAV
jgi:ubiquinone biosynthesis protein